MRCGGSGEVNTFMRGMEGQRGGDPGPGCVDCTRYRICDIHPYLDREEEYGDLTLDEAVARMDDLTGVGADVILADLDSDGLDVLPWKWVDDETGREVALRLEVEPPPQPEAGGMSLADGLGADPAHEVGGTTHRPDQPQIPEAAKSAAYKALGIGDNPRLKRESTAARINERTRVDVALKAALPAILQANDAEVKLAEVEEQSVARGDRVIELERRLVDERSKATDAAKFAEREYERVCEERDSVTESYERMKHARTVALQERNAERAKLAQVREAVALRADEAERYDRGPEAAFLRTILEAISQPSGANVNVREALHSVETRNAIADALMSGRPNNQERDLKWGESAILTNRHTALTAAERIMEALRLLLVKDDSTEVDNG